MEAVQVGDSETNERLLEAAQEGAQEINLRRAAQEGDIEAFYALIPSNPRLLEQMDEKPFVDTPLHVAAQAGKTQFAMEMMRLKPSFARKPNHSGFSPMHLALQNGHTSLVLRLVDIDPNLVRVKGREGFTPLHYVAKTGDVKVLAEFLVVCPKSIEDLTIRMETALHVAMKNHQFEAVEVLMGWIQRRLHGAGLELKEKVLNWKDEDDNTMLHIATSCNRFEVIEVVRSLLINGVDVNSKNLRDRTALDIIEVEQVANTEILKKMLLRFGALRCSSLPSTVAREDYLRSKISYFESLLIFIMRRKLYISSENRNALLVVAVLMVTSTYQISINPPGGVWKDNNTPANYLNTTITTTTRALDASSPSPHHVGSTVLTPFLFYAFTFYNSAALWSSVAIIFVLLPHEKFAYVLLIPLSAFLLCHLVSVYIISGGASYMYFFFGYAINNLILVSVLTLFGRARARRLRGLLLRQTLSQ